MYPSFALYYIEIRGRIERTKVWFPRTVRQQGQHQGGDHILCHGSVATAQRYKRGADVQPGHFHEDRRPTVPQRVYNSRRRGDVACCRRDAVPGQDHYDEKAAVHLGNRNDNHRRE